MERQTANLRREQRTRRSESSEERVTQLHGDCDLGSIHDLRSLTGELWSEFCKTMKSTERRKERRLGLRWPIRLSSHVIGQVETKTENLSSGGFYCILENPLANVSVLISAG